jgi:hypothetical protein
MFFLRFSTFSPFFAVKLTFFYTFISVSGNLVITVLKRKRQQRTQNSYCTDWSWWGELETVIG